MQPHVNRRANAAAAIVREEWGTLTWLAAGRLGNSQAMTLGLVTIQPGHANPRHAHFQCEEVLHLLRGSLHHTLGDEAVDLAAGDTLTIPAGVFHNATSTGAESAEMVVAYPTAVRDMVIEPPFVPEDDPSTYE